MFAYADDALSEFELSFVGADGVEQRELLSRCWHLAFEQGRPVRSFPTYVGQRSFSGLWWFATTGEHVGYESWLERDNVMALDFAPEVAAVASQPFWLSWETGRGQSRHAPDYFVRFGDGNAGVVDVRADDRIEPEDAAAFAATERACREVGWSFRRVGELEPAFCRNVRWLSRYAHPRCSGRPDTVRWLLDVFAVPTQLFAGAGRIGDPLEVLPAVYHLMWLQVLSADLTGRPMRPATLVGPGSRWPL